MQATSDAWRTIPCGISSGQGLSPSLICKFQVQVATLLSTIPSSHSIVLSNVQVEGTFRDGTKLVTIHEPFSSEDGDLALALHGSFLPGEPDPDILEIVYFYWHVLT